MNREDPPVFFTFGSLMPTDRKTTHEVLDLWSDAARRVGVPGILQCENTWEWSATDHVRVVTRCPHQDIFPSCAAVVHHGGAGTTHACVCAGVPSIVVPHVADQFFWGATLRHMHLGTVTRKRRSVSADEIAKQLRKVMNNREVKLACEEARTIARSEDGVSRAVEIIESLSIKTKPSNEKSQHHPIPSS